MNSETPIPPARGAATRAALIEAAIHVFGHDGFDAASTRAIADEAGANQALISYHFGGKPGLYLAAMQHIANRVAARLGPLAATIEAELGASGSAAAISSERALELLHELLGAFVAMLTSDESAAWARLILREQQEPSEAFDVLYTAVIQRMFGLMARLIGRVRGEPADSAATRLMAVSFIGQALVFRAARAAAMRQMGWEQVGPEEIGMIQDLLRRNVTAILKEDGSQ